MKVLTLFTTIGSSGVETVTIKHTKAKQQQNYLVGDSQSKYTDALSFDGCDLVIQFISVIRRYAVSDEDNDTINIRAQVLVRTEHFQSCYLQTAGRVRVFA